mmetsp:Transcript_19433/g.22508  ORF Transcript_19433/g.22508 Transcript_19433/m.22508 type:complete len:336 (+) Transcript_19433:110-1117(+)
MLWSNRLNLSAIVLALFHSSLFVGAEIVISLAPAPPSDEPGSDMYFKPFKPVTTECFSDPNASCEGIFPISLESNSKLTINWFASPHNDKYLSFDMNAQTLKIHFFFHIGYPCSEVKYQKITGESMDVSSELLYADGLPAELEFDPLNSYVELGRQDQVWAQDCEIFSRVAFKVAASASDFTFNIARFTSSVNYDNSNVVLGINDYAWKREDSKIDFAGAAPHQLLYKPSAPSTSPTKSQSPTPHPTLSPTILQTAPPTPSPTNLRTDASGNSVVAGSTAAGSDSTSSTNTSSPAAAPTSQQTQQPTVPDSSSNLRLTHPLALFAWCFVGTIMLL